MSAVQSIGLPQQGNRVESSADISASGMEMNSGATIIEMIVASGPGAYCLLDAEGACGDHEEADDDELKHPDPLTTSRGPALVCFDAPAPG